MNDSKPDYGQLKVTDSSAYDAQRGTHRTKQVHFTMADGTRTFIEVPLDQFTPDNVQRLIEQAVDTHKQVVSMTPGQPAGQGGSSPGPFG